MADLYCEACLSEHEHIEPHAKQQMATAKLVCERVGTTEEETESVLIDLELDISTNLLG